MNAQTANDAIPESGGNPALLSYHDDPLWRRICAHELDDSSAVEPFSGKLAREQNWSAEFTQKAILEYKKFIYLCCTSEDGASPSPVADEVWHLHLTYTTDYWGKFCKDTLGKELHHFPSAGGADEKEKHRRWYEHTYQLYTTTFGQQPPADTWPPPATDKSLADAINVAPGMFNRIPKVSKLPLLLFPFLLTGVFYHGFNPFQLAGAHFLLFYATLAFITVTMTKSLCEQNGRLLGEIIKNHLTQFGTYEIRVLSGDGPGAEQKMLGEVLDEAVLLPLYHDNMFTVNENKDVIETNPLSYRLRNGGRYELSKDEVKGLIATIVTDIKSRYTLLKREYDNRWNLRLVPAVVLLIGVVRMVQGIINEKSIAFLVMMAVIFVISCSLIFKAHQFEITCKYIFNEIVVSETGESAFKNAGTMGLLALLFTDTMRQSGNNAGDSGSSCGSGNCGGSSCGGGCGGCSGN